MSAVGKPVYARRGTDDVIFRICGLVQALRSSLASLPSLGDVRCVRSGDLCLVFMSVCSLTMVAIGGKTETEAHLKLQLEYMAGQILFSVTDRVQHQFSFDPGFDMRSIFGASDARIVDGILDDSSSMKNPGPFWVGAAETLFPLSAAIRSMGGNSMKVTGLKTDFTAFALLTAGEKLVSMIQPASPEYQMRVADLQLLLNVVNRQPHLFSRELWFPVCLPLFSSQDFLFCYTQCWDEASKLCLVLLSQQSTTQQFQLFKEASANIRRSLGLPPPETSVLEILDCDSIGNGLANNQHTGDVNSTIASSLSIDVKWRRSEEDPSVDEEYETVSFGDLDAVLPYLPNARVHDSVFLREVREACRPGRLQGHLEQYIAIGSALHFLFRMEVPLMPLSVASPSSKFTQCLTLPLGFPFTDEASKLRVWSTYHDLRLRLCLGNGTVECTMGAWDKTQSNSIVCQRQAKPAPPPLGAASRFPAISLAGASPETEEKLSFVRDRSELYVALKGKDYEFYCLLPGTTSLKDGTILASKIVRQLFEDQQSLFLYHPLTWEV